MRAVSARITSGSFPITHDCGDEVRSEGKLLVEALQHNAFAFDIYKWLAQCQHRYDNRMTFSATGNSFSIHEWRGSGPARLHVHHSDDEAWHVLEGELTFHYSDRTETAGPGTTVFIPAGTPHSYVAAPGARYLIILTPRLKSLISTLQSDRDPAHQHGIYRQHESELLE